MLSIDFPLQSDNSTQVMEEEVTKLIVHLLADENHKFMRPHAGGEDYDNIKRKRTQLARDLRWFLSFALRIPTAHDFCVVSARKWARARTKRKGPSKRGHIVADTMLPMMFLGLRKLGNICCGHIFCVPDTKFLSATNVARAGKQGNISVGNNVSATMCPRLPGP